MFRHLTDPQNVPDWVRERVAPLGDAQLQAWATSLSIFDYLHRRQLSAIQSDEIREHRDAGRMLAELSACRPLGALYARAEMPGYRPHDFTCGRNRQCPWCHARKVLALYERLLEGPCRRERLAGKYLVRFQVRVTSDRLAYMSSFVRF